MFSTILLSLSLRYVLFRQFDITHVASYSLHIGRYMRMRSRLNAVHFDKRVVFRTFALITKRTKRLVMVVFNAGSFPILLVSCSAFSSRLPLHHGYAMSTRRKRTFAPRCFESIGAFQNVSHSYRRARGAREKTNEFISTRKTTAATRREIKRKRVVKFSRSVATRSINIQCERTSERARAVYNDV